MSSAALVGLITTWDDTCSATSHSSLAASAFQPPLVFLALRGNTTRLALYSRRRCSLACLPFTERLRRRGSTAMPKDCASNLPKPCALSSAREKPRPIRTLALYLRVGGCTTGRTQPAMGRGATV